MIITIFQKKKDDDYEQLPFILTNNTAIRLENSSSNLNWQSKDDFFRLLCLGIALDFGHKSRFLLNKCVFMKNEIVV